MNATVELMTRAGCHACAAAEQHLRTVLADYGLEPSIVDVDEAAQAGDSSLRAEYGDRVPVIVLDGEEHGYWEVDEPRLRADLDTRR
ncbi:glutaredoxin family protein [Gordonia sp. HY442]|uniref:glutaredoxin family protein n=1 Tax=Gordonia zhenghanii TaxID=2911516 RepID=UPI001F450ED1|nr:glutaredoxin family protein [Gordonia zhenghanii]MCF8604777.1 glutaredoxin family protein [Gordonia zhenghanii]